DPFRSQANIDAVLGTAREADADVTMFDYPGHGHLFTDASLPDEFDAHAAELLWQRVLAFPRSGQLTAAKPVPLPIGFRTREPVSEWAPFPAIMGICQHARRMRPTTLSAIRSPRTTRTIWPASPNSMASSATARACVGD